MKNKKKKGEAFRNVLDLYLGGKVGGKSWGWGFGREFGMGILYERRNFCKINQQF